MIDWTLSVHIVTSGDARAVRLTRASLPRHGNVVVTETPWERWWAHAGSPAPVHTTWHLLLFEGETVDAGELLEALEGGQPDSTPRTACPPSLAPDPFAHVTNRLTVDPPAAGSRGAWEPSASSGTPWTMSAPALADRLERSWVSWARDAGADLTLQQVRTNGSTSPVLAGLLLLAGEWDAVLTRAQVVLRANPSREESVHWARAGLAAAACAARWPEANVLWHRWIDRCDDEGEISLGRTWRTVLDVARDDPSALREADGQPPAHPDPWVYVHQRAIAGRRVRAAADEVARGVRVARDTGQVSLLVEASRLAGWDARELVSAWPGTDVAVLLHAVQTCEGCSADWWLQVAEAVLDHGHIPVLAEAAGVLAAKVSLDQALRWSLRGERADNPGPSPLALRVLDLDLDPVVRLEAAAAGWVAGVVEHVAFLEAVAAVHDDEALAALQTTDRIAPRLLPELVTAFCSGLERTTVMQTALRQVGADEQATALDGLVDLFTMTAASTVEAVGRA